MGNWCVVQLCGGAAGSDRQTKRQTDRPHQTRPDPHTHTKKLTSSHSHVSIIHSKANDMNMIYGTSHLYHTLAATQPAHESPTYLPTHPTYSTHRQHVTRPSPCQQTPRPPKQSSRSRPAVVAQSSRSSPST